MLVIRNRVSQVSIIFPVEFVFHIVGISHR